LVVSALVGIFLKKFLFSFLFCFSLVGLAATGSEILFSATALLPPLKRKYSKVEKQISELRVDLLLL
jgi:hypothetical protein